MCACGGVMNDGKSMMVAWLELLGVGVWSRCVGGSRDAQGGDGLR